MLCHLCASQLYVQRFVAAACALGIAAPKLCTACTPTSDLAQVAQSRRYTTHHTSRCRPVKRLNICPTCRRQARPASPITPRASSQASNTELVPDAAFTLAKISFGDILTPIGIFLMVFGFGAYFQLIPGADVSGVALIYGFPMLLLGFALKYAQLEPVPCETTRAAFDARETQMTDNLKQVREDCTRYRCDRHHMCCLAACARLRRVFQSTSPCCLLASAASSTP